MPRPRASKSTCPQLQPCLRHAFAALALEAVSRALGHASLATTADVYGHWTPALRERLAQRMDEGYKLG